MVDMGMARCRSVARRRRSGPPRRHGVRADPPGRLGGRLDPDAAALALSMSVTLRKTIELAGAVRDLVYHRLTEDRSISKSTNRLFTAAMDAVPETPEHAGAGFARAFEAASSLPDPAAGPIQEIVKDEVEKSLGYLACWGANQAAADAFAAALPSEADALAGQSKVRSGRQARLNHLRMLAGVFRAAAPDGTPGWPPDGRDMAAFDRAARAAGSRTADDAWGPGEPAFALAAAASAVMVAAIPDYPRDFLRRTAPGLCGDLSGAISSAGGPPDLASTIPASMLEGALEYPDDGPQASGEAAVRAVRTAHVWASTRAATSAFRAAYGVAAGAAWASAPDRDRFESVHGPALKAAGGLDPVVHYAFDTLREHSWEKLPFDDADEHVWEFFYGASGRTMAGWVEIARGVDYQAAATSRQNAALINAYRISYDAASGAAARTAARLRKAGR